MLLHLGLQQKYGQVESALDSPAGDPGSVRRRT